MGTNEVDSRLVGSPSGEDGEGVRSGVLVTGATGLVGRRLLPGLARRSAWVRTLSRSGAAPEGEVAVDAGSWDGIDPGPTSLDGVASVIHLAGEPVFGGLPSADRLTRIRASRIDSTTRLVERILERTPDDRPSTFICASAVGYYGDRGAESLSDDAAMGEGYLAEVCRDWEAAAAAAAAAGIRVVHLRIGVVLAPAGGAHPFMRLPFSLGVGGRLGSGEQYFPWIHADDLVRSILFCLDEPIEGPVNAVAPEAVTNAELTRELGAALRRPAVIPVPAFAVKIALGEISGELLGSRLVVPKRLQEAGFAFEYPTLKSALEAELRKVRA
jgi:uncharacterized protein (TIGR01777 family)